MAERLTELSPSEFRSLLNGLALMSQLYWGPTPELCQDLTTSELAEELMELGNILQQGSAESAHAMVGSLQAIKDPDQLYAALEPLYVATFINAPGGCTVPLYHSCYENDEGLMMGPPARMMQKRLDMVGLDLEKLGPEPPDHLSVELEYLFLMLEQAYSQDDPHLLSLAQEFAAKEMLPWLEPFRGRMPDSDECMLYPAATDLLLAMLRLTAA